MKSTHLDADEKALSESFDRGDWRPVKSAVRERKKLREAARNTLRKDARINIRLSSKDLSDLQVVAAREGIPYQTLVSSILHKYVAGSGLK
jgi:predicted DNA binding CopG/RHH family protein